MKIWAIGDLHLSFGIPNKEMDIFGERWKKHTERVEASWRACVNPEDLVLIPGDISWALHLDEVKPDLAWIHNLPGSKVMLRGNHDYWWGSLRQIQQILPSSIHLIQNNAFTWQNITIGGSRLWDTKEYNFNDCIEYVPNARKRPREEVPDLSDNAERIYERELQRLETSLRCLDPNASRKIAMTHYPPIGADLASDTRASRLLKRYGIDTCVFGHLHNVATTRPIFGTRDGIRYLLTSCDYLNCSLLEIDLLHNFEYR